MRCVGIFEAKAKLSQLVQSVENGEEIVLTRHGKSVARLVSSTDKAQTWSASNWASELRSYRCNRDHGATPGATLRELIAAGRR